ncbi:MAG: T9SS type A sorting domain-containing protein, partial [Bacteroidales bacterium]
PQDKKERTKIIQLKVVEDEDGTVKTIDTTWVSDGDGWFGYHDFEDHQFDVDIPNIDSLMQNVKVWTNDRKGFSYQYDNIDSLMFWIDVNSIDHDSVEEQMVVIKKLRSSLEDLQDRMKSHQFRYEFFRDGDSLHQLILENSGRFFDSLDLHDMYLFRFGNEDGKLMVTGNEIAEILKDGKGHPVILQIDADGDTYVDCSVDTTFTEGNNKVVVKTGTSDGKKYKIITITSKTEQESKPAEEKSVSLRMISPEAQEMDGLKDAGVKTKSRELDVESLRISPNPGTGKFKLSFTLKEPKQVTVNIFDLNGELVYTETLHDFRGTYSKEIDISEQGSGPFFLQIIQGLYDIIKKIIIQ